MMALFTPFIQEIAKHAEGNRNKEAGYLQEQVLKDLMQKSRNTHFGKHYHFNQLLKSNDIRIDFKNQVPIFNYEKIYNEWWFRNLNGEPNVCWPGKIKYFGLTSGTSNASSKKVPITGDMIFSIRKASIKQMFSIAKTELPKGFFDKGVLMLGGSTSLTKVSDYFEGDLSGIMASNLPFWFTKLYKPGYSISKVKDWETKLQSITENAYKWDITAICGVPSWIQILFERIIAYYNLKNIHEIWPNLSVYIHGGVSYEPYRKSIDALLGKPIRLYDTYLASEGFMAFQKNTHSPMELELNNGIYFEFVPYNQTNFNELGDIYPHAQALTIDEVSENTDYAILISTNAGAWRYLIGDTIRFVNKLQNEIIITGRTKHFLSLCGEHLSVDNMTTALMNISNRYNLIINEFTVAGLPCNQGGFYHQWYIGIDDFDNKYSEKLALLIDAELKILNDDYATERMHALKDVSVKILPTNVFYDWMKACNKLGGQNKFPRVINQRLDDWEQFINQKRG